MGRVKLTAVCVQYYLIYVRGHHTHLRQRITNVSPVFKLRNYLMENVHVMQTHMNSELRVKDKSVQQVSIYSIYTVLYSELSLLTALD